MKKKTWLRLLEACVFVALACVMVIGASRVLERKASRNQFGPFLENPQQYDVLFFGDSHFVNSLFPMEIWEDYGIPGYNLACYGNTMPVNYWAMMNAFDYAKPKVVVVAVNGVHRDFKVTGSSSDLHTALDFYPLSRMKARAIEDLMDDPYAADDDGNRYVDMKWEYYFTLGKYHSRWNEITKGDFVGNPNVQKGALMMLGVAPAQEYDLIDPDRYDEESAIGYGYLRRIIEECQAREIEVLLVHLPYQATEEAQMSANTAGSIAEEYGVNYIDFVQLDSVVDYATDAFDQHAHLNPSGGWKVTDFLGQYLQAQYALEDRREDAAYAAWEQESEAYKESVRELVRAEDDLANLLVMLHDDDVNAFVAIRDGADFYWDDLLITLLHNAEREHVFNDDAYSMWSNSMYPLDGLEDVLYSDEAYFLMLDRNGAGRSEYVGAEAFEQAQQYFGESVWEEGKEVRLRIQDKLTGEVLAEHQF